jgi:hypothetical protein
MDCPLQGGSQAAYEREKANELGERRSLRREQAPFLADLRPGEEQLAIDNNLYRAPLFPHRAAPTDFLLVRERLLAPRATRRSLASPPLFPRTASPNPFNTAFSSNPTQVCYDDDYDVCTYVVRELPKVLLDAQRKPIEPPAKAWAALGLSAAFVKASRAAFVEELPLRKAWQTF